MVIWAGEEVSARFKGRSAGFSGVRRWQATVCGKVQVISREEVFSTFKQRTARAPAVAGEAGPVNTRVRSSARVAGARVERRSKDRRLKAKRRRLLPYSMPSI
jgi:negative regulator of sigma E activity